MGLGDCTVLVSEFMRSSGRSDGASYGAVQWFMAGGGGASATKLQKYAPFTRTGRCLKGDKKPSALPKASYKGG